jgi:hypothetical protein
MITEDSTTTKNTNTLTTESDITPHIKETSSSSTGQTPSDNKDTTAVSKESNTKPADNVQPPMIMSSNTPTNLTSAATGGDIDPHKTTENTGVHSHTGNAPKADILAPTDRSGNPGAAPASGAAPFAKQQGADKPSQAPLEEAKDAINIKTDDAERLLKSHDPNDHSGEPMKMHDGNEIKVPLTQEERRTSTAGNPGGQEHGKEPKGTGEQYIKSTGVAADGGDFDATKPGAGREADSRLHKFQRTLSKADMVAGLREEKGIKKATTSGDVDKTTSAGSHASGDKEKTKLSDMIKDKLHIGHKNK